MLHEAPQGSVGELPARHRRLHGDGRQMSGTRTMLAAVLFLAGTLSASAQNEQIQGPEDAKCRGEARNLVFSAPNPKRLSPFDLGVET